VRSLTLLAFLFSSASVACTTTVLPPPEPPPRELPPQEEPLPTESDGLSRVIITSNVPARVERVRHGKELLCAETPCTVTLPYGDYELVFTGRSDHQRTSTALVSVRRPSTVVNHALGQERGNPLRVVGALVFVTGLAMVVVAAAMAEDANEKNERTPKEAAPVAMAGFGSVLFGGLIIGLTPTKIQEGSTTQWTPSPSFAGATVSAGMKF